MSLTSQTGENGPLYEIVIDWSQPLDGCDPRIQQIVTNAKAFRASIDAHTCDQMRLAAGGQPVADITMRQPSARVAQEYLDVFCSER